MCGVIGYYSNNFRKNEKIIEKLIRESSIRGTHSYGFSYLDGENIITVKTNEIEQIIEQIKTHQPTRFIFHNRYSTSGDWKDHNNNQPITKIDSSLVFNGVISQATKEENEEKYGLDLETDNDGEILLEQRDKDFFIRTHRGSFAGLMIEGNRFKVFRNQRRPLWFSRLKDSLFIASTKNILYRSGLELAEEVPNKKLMDFRDL